jgi:hypothetical protein
MIRPNGFLHSEPPTERPWLVRYSSPSLGTVELSAVSREEALTKMRDELQYRIEWCLCSGASGDTVELQVQEERGRP